MHTENDLTNGKVILVDLTVAGLNVQMIHRAQDKGGVLAEKAEKRKIDEVNRYWKLNPNVEILPFAVEYTGGLGVYARRFLHDVLAIPKPPSDQTPPHIATARRIERDAKMQALYGFKATVTAAVWRGNYSIYQAYVNSLEPPGLGMEIVTAQNLA